jgi:hypothetical protein
LSCSANLARPQPDAILLGMFPRLLSLLAVLLCCTVPLEARVVRVEVSSRTDVLDGQQFGEAGTYERIVGLREVSQPLTRCCDSRLR